ncbi:glycosyltransferase [Nostoc sp. WHI]|uniref:glycosyltransferase n=1 Tax=Nostoc sp. WHI TaxID=2650611 RepID=UPI0018C7F5B1|nr:glycosyltransferase [Nostoc sp. WHI]MBG1266329.1 glycosyltransferase [Nostoc sp. WHI]
MLPEYIKPSEFTNWALTSESLEWISQFVEAAGIRKVVECGSGLSTILFGSFKLEKVLSLEHDSNWYAYTRQRLQEKGLLEYVDLQLCHLQQSIWNGNSVKWYDINNVSSFAADLILVDGPPQESSLRARYPAPHLLKAFIQPGTWLLLDDYSRHQETEIVNLWLKEIPELELIKVAPFKHGLAVLRYKGSSESFTENAQEAPISEPSSLIKLDKNIGFLEEKISQRTKEDFLIGKSLKRQTLDIQIHQQPLVSIIIPCQNAGKMIKRCLSSCFQQVYPHLEIIIVDNNSTDDSIQIAKQLAEATEHRVIFTQCQQIGVNSARKHGFTIAQGSYIQWLDADDELTPNKIALQVNALEQNRQFDIAYGSWEWCFYQNDQYQHKLVFPSENLNDPLRYLLLQYWHPPHAYLLCRSAAQQLNQMQAWHPQRQINTDLEYFTLASVLGLRFLNVPTATVRYNHWSETQTSRSTPYWQRVQSLKQIAVRFQHYATEQQVQQLSVEHRFLLGLNWDFWSLAPIQIRQEGKACFWLQHLSKAVGMTLTPAEARIVLAMKYLGSVDTLMGHTNQIIRFLWKQVVLHPEVYKMSVTEALSVYVGLLLDNDLTFSEKPLLPPSQSSINLLNLITTVPLQAPLFTEQREAILRILDKLRVTGLLMQVTPKTSKQVSTAFLTQPLG